MIARARVRVVCGIMALVTLDVVLVLPGELREQAQRCNKDLSSLMAARQRSSHFRLGEPFPGGDGGVCEPHVSLFMLCVEDAEVPAVVDTVRRIAEKLPALSAEGHEYRYNHHGAPELFFRKSEECAALQRAVVPGVESLRRGRLRELDPAGERLNDVVTKSPADYPSRVRQLLEYGYDDVADDTDNRSIPTSRSPGPRTRISESTSAGYRPQPPSAER